jgi:purine nucleosidase
MIKKTNKLGPVRKVPVRKVSLDTGCDSKKASDSKHDAYSQSLGSDIDLQLAGPVQGRRKIIFDTDMGADDAIAYLVCMSQPDVEILAVTTASGNHHVDQVCANVATMNRNMDTQHVPIHRGCDQGIIDAWKPCGWEGHGKDGLGDSVNLKRDNLQKIESKHAVQAIIDLVLANPNEVEILMIGPLTNLGMAIRMEPRLPSLIKSVTVMGGTIGGKGNHSAAAEFNFIMDPEAADIVFKSFECSSD